MQVQQASSTLRPFPLAPLARKLGLAPDDTAGLSVALRIHRSSVNRYRALGLTRDQADEWACKAGFHPVEVWDLWRSGLHGAALANASKERCPAGHPLDRRDSRGDRCCAPCPPVAAKRYRERKSLLTTPMTATLIESNIPSMETA
jgi:hypothetical protein